MARLPTVRLVHRRDHTNFRIVDQVAYARDMAKWKDFKIAGFAGGDSTDAQVEAAVREMDANQARHEARDAEREFHRNDITVTAEAAAALAGRAADDRVVETGGGGSQDALVVGTADLSAELPPVEGMTEYAVSGAEAVVADEPDDRRTTGRRRGRR